MHHALRGVLFLPCLLALALLSLPSSSNAAPIEFKSKYAWLTGDPNPEDTTGFEGWYAFDGNAVTPYVVLQSFPGIDELEGLGMYPVGGKVYTSDGIGSRWSFDAPGSTSIKDAHFKMIWYRNPELESTSKPQGQYLKIGLIDGAGWSDVFEHPSSVDTPEFPAGDISPLVNYSTFLVDPDGNSNYAVFEFATSPCTPTVPGASHPCRWVIEGFDEAESAYAYFGQVELTLVDWEDPAVNLSGQLKQLEGLWVKADESYQLGIGTDDPGSGIKEVKVKATDSQGQTHELETLDGNCDPEHYANSDGSICEHQLNEDVDISLENLAQGDATITVTATDWAGHITTSQFTVKVDTQQPATPETLTLEGKDAGATATWSEVPPDDGSPIDHYKVAYSTDQGQNWSTPQNTTQLTKEIQDVPTGQEVQVELEAVDQAGWNSDATTASTTAYAASVPGQGKKAPPKAKQKKQPVASAAGGPDLRDCSGGSPCGSYSRAKAKRYALRWAKGTNDPYVRFKQDCTNFISQALEAGGFNYMREWQRGQGSWWYHPLMDGSSGTYTQSWSLANKFIAHMKEYGLFRKTSHHLRDWKVWDVIAFNFYGNGEQFDHLAIVTGGTKKEPRLSYHTSDQRHLQWSIVKGRMTRQHGVLWKSWSYINYRPVHTRANISR